MGAALISGGPCSRTSWGGRVEWVGPVVSFPTETGRCGGTEMRGGQSSSTYSYDGSRSTSALAMAPKRVTHLRASPPVGASKVVHPRGVVTPGSPFTRDGRQCRVGGVEGGLAADEDVAPIVTRWYVVTSAPFWWGVVAAAGHSEVGGECSIN